MTRLRSVLAAAVLLAGSLPAYAATATSRDLVRIPFNLAVLFVVSLVLVGIGNKAMLMGRACRAWAARRIKLIFGMPAVLAGAVARPCRDRLAEVGVDRLVPLARPGGADVRVRPDQLGPGRFADTGRSGLLRD